MALFWVENPAPRDELSLENWTSFSIESGFPDSNLTRVI
jgi:hypothetical protein